MIRKLFCCAALVLFLIPATIVYSLTDTDNDGMPDTWEIQYGLNPNLDDADNDADHDSISNYEEYQFNTNPIVSDTDNDGLSDGEEIPGLSGTEFKINTYTTNFKQVPSVTSNGTNYLVTWASNAQDGDGYGIYGQFYDADANPAGLEFQINTHTAQDQSWPAVTSNGSNYLVTWMSDEQDGSDWGIYGQLYDPDGTPSGSEFQINTYTTNHQSAPSVTSNGTSYMVTWASYGQDGNEYGIYGQFYDDDGTPAGSEFRINTYTTGTQYGPCVSSNGTTYLVTWESDGQDGSNYGIYGQFYDDDGTPAGSEFRINTCTTNAQVNPAISSNGTSYLVTWASYGQDGNDYGIYGQFYNSNGTAAGSEFKVNTSTTNAQSSPSVSSNGTSYLVTWENFNQGIYGQLYNSDRTPFRSEFRINTSTTDLQHYPSVSHTGPNYLVTWESVGLDVSGYHYGIYGNTVSGGYETNPLLADTDGDSMNDGDEVYAGMEPDNIHSLFALTKIKKEIVVSGIKLTWNCTSKLNRIYKIFWKDSLKTSWNQIDYTGWDLDIINNGNGTKSWIDEGEDDLMTGAPLVNTKSRFYKVVVEIQ